MQSKQQIGVSFFKLCLDVECYLFGALIMVVILSLPVFLALSLAVTVP